jgi:hypothetical protein
VTRSRLRRACERDSEPSATERATAEQAIGEAIRRVREHERLLGLVRSVVERGIPNADETAGADDCGWCQGDKRHEPDCPWPQLCPDIAAELKAEAEESRVLREKYRP